MEGIIGTTAKKINGMIDAEDLLDILMISPDSVLRENGKLRIHCPIHEDKIIHSLSIDPISNTYRCTYFQCKGTRGGDLLDLYCEATGNKLQEAVIFWAKRLGLSKETLAQLEKSAESVEMAALSETKIERVKTKQSAVGSSGPSKSTTAILDEQEPIVAIREPIKPPVEKSPAPVSTKKEEIKIEPKKPVVKQEPPKAVDQEIKLPKILKEGHVMDITKKSNPGEASFFEMVEQLKDIEPDWYRQYRLQDAIYMAQGARSEAIVRAQAEALMEYWEKHSQNIKAYQQNSFSLDEFQEFERKLMETKRKKLNQSYNIGEKAFRETYDSIMKDILASSEMVEDKEKVLVNA